jgi:hypothetical protein
MSVAARKKIRRAEETMGKAEGGSEVEASDQNGYVNDAV